MAVHEIVHRGRVKDINDRLHKIDLGIRECRFRIGVVKARLVGTPQYEFTLNSWKNKVAELNAEGQRLLHLRNDLYKQHDAAIAYINGDDVDADY